MMSMRMAVMYLHNSYRHYVKLYPRCVSSQFSQIHTNKSYKQMPIIGLVSNIAQSTDDHAQVIRQASIDQLIVYNVPQLLQLHYTQMVVLGLRQPVYAYLCIDGMGIMQVNCYSFSWQLGIQRNIIKKIYKIGKM